MPFEFWITTRLILINIGTVSLADIHLEHWSRISAVQQSSEAKVQKKQTLGLLDIGQQCNDLRHETGELKCTTENRSK